MLTRADQRRVDRDVESARVNHLMLGAELERQHAAREAVWRVAFALLWDNVALYAAIEAVTEAGWPWPRPAWLYMMVTARDEVLEA
jgi:hypothetical protein